MGVRDGGFEGLRIYKAGGIVDEDDTLERGHSFGGAKLGVKVWDEVLKERNIRAGRFAGLIGLSADDEMGSF